MAVNGSAVLIAVNIGTNESPDFEIIPCQTSGEYDLSRETVDTSCKDSPDNTNIPGAADRTVSVESNISAWPELVANPANAEMYLRKAAETGTQVKGAIVVSGTRLEEFTATITSLQISADRESPTTMSIELAISGALTPVAA
jgi:predicted secreted protein